MIGDKAMAGTLTAQEVERYHRDGYLSPVRATDADRAGDFLARYDGFKARGETDADMVLRSKPHLVFPWLYDLVQDPAVTEPVSAILGPNLLAWGSSFFAKPAGDPGYVSWHQDANYWGLEPHEILTAWIAFSPSRRENGCMRVVPASQHEALDHRDTFAKDNLLTRGQEIAVEVNEDRAADITLAPGEMSLHHIGIVHGSDPNTSDTPRIGFAIRYIASHVRQLGGRTTATLARGEDTHGHFDLEPRPTGEYEAAGLAFREQALARQHAVLFAGAEKGSDG
jgi:non-haem Fe2+, alpha-ketoglutarate-dependent halogenase